MASRPQKSLGTTNPTKSQSFQASSQGGNNDPERPDMPNIAALNVNQTQTALKTRPGYGNVGTKVAAHANFFEVDISKCQNITFYTYALTDPNAIGRLSKSRVLRRCASLLMRHNTAFSRSATNYVNQFFSVDSHPLVGSNRNEATYTVDYYEAEEAGPRQGDRQLLISIRVVKVMTFMLQQFTDYFRNTTTGRPPQTANFVTMVNALLDRAISENTSMTTLARRTKFFNIADKSGRKDLSRGLEAHRGFFKSVRDCAGGLFLNLNASAGAFYKEYNLNRLISEMGGALIVGTKLRGAKVSHLYTGSIRIKTIETIAPSSDRQKPPTADIVNFDCPEHGKGETVAQHFAKKYPNARRADLQAIVVNLGNNVFVPSDLLQMRSAQPFRGPLLPEQTSAMIQFACRFPDDNKKLILNEGISAFQLNSANSPRSRFNLSLSSDMVKIEARRLPAPSMIFAKASTAMPTGSWNMNSRQVKQGPVSGPWVATCIEVITRQDKTPRNTPEFIKAIKAAFSSYFKSDIPQFRELDAQTRRVVVTEPNKPAEIGPQLVNVFEGLLHKGFHLVFVVLPDNSAENYYLVKKAADTRVGIHTICVVPKEKREVKTDPMTIANLILKVNQKLGGVNHSFKPDTLYESVLGSGALPTMFIGADVTHPGPSAMINAPSIAAVVATYENTFTQYPGGVRLQQHRDETKKSLEMIAAFGDMVKERLTLYHAKNNSNLPERIIYIRDGVSDGQFDQVLNEEVLGEQGLIQACKEFYTQSGVETPPKVTVIVAQKRHHTRFYTQNKDLQNFDKNANPLPGFVVDRTIVSPTNFDFYCTSHATIKGTSRPAKYTVIYDTNEMSPDQVQMLIYHSCFNFGRATKSIGIHPAARYADLLCDRARVYLRRVYAPTTDAFGNKPTYSLQGGHWAGWIAPSLRHEMFYI